MYFGHIYIKLHEDTEFRNMYEKEKDKFVAETIELAGKFLSGLRKDKNKKKVIDTEFEGDKQKNQSKIVVGKFPFKTIEHLKKHLKTCENRITIKEYMILIGCSEKTARGIFNKFVKRKELNYFNEGRTEVYYSTK